MSGLVTVRVLDPAASDARLRAALRGGPALGVRLLPAAGGPGFTAVARGGAAGSGPADDEHLAVDVDRRDGGRSHDRRDGGRSHDRRDGGVGRGAGGVRRYADVLYARRARSVAGAVREALALLAAYPGCRLAAVADPAGWTLAAGPDPVRLPADRAHPLLPSVVHTWLLTGHDLGALRDRLLVQRE